MKNIVFTQLSTSELRTMLREEIESFFTANPIPNKIDIPDRFLDKKETAELLNCAVSTVDNMKRGGDLPFYRLGSKVVFKRSEVMEAVEKKKANRSSLN